MRFHRGGSELDGYGRGSGGRLEVQGGSHNNRPVATSKLVGRRFVPRRVTRGVVTRQGEEPANESKLRLELDPELFGELEPLVSTPQASCG